MKYKIEKVEEAGIKPEVGQLWTYDGYTAYIRINDHEGARACAMAPDTKKFFSVSIESGHIVWSSVGRPNVRILKFRDETLVPE